MNMPFCWLLTMSIVKLALKIDMFKMEHAFFIGYWEVEKAFYVSTNWQGEEKYVCNHIDTLSSFWKENNARFEKFMAKDLNLY